MYRVKLNGNFNVCINDLNTVFTYNRPEKTFSDDEFENSDDIKRYIGKFLTAEYIDIKKPKPVKKSENVEKPIETKAEVKTKIETIDDKDRIIVEEKATISKSENETIIADNASLPKEATLVSDDSDIIVANGKSSEKHEVAKEDENSVRVDNFGNTVKNTETVAVEEPEAKAQNVEKSKKSTKKKTKISFNKNDGVEKTNE